MATHYEEYIEEVVLRRKTCFRVGKRDEFGQYADEPVLISCPLDFREKDEFLYAIPHDNNCRVIADQYRFINHHHRRDAENTRRSIAKGLRLYNCFKAAHHLTDDILTPDMVDMLIAFLCGYDFNPTYSHMLTSRSQAVVDNILSSIRTYLSYIGKPCAYLEASRVVSIITEYDGLHSTIQRTKYLTSQAKDSHKDDYAPDHILPDEYRRLREIAFKRGNNQAIIMMALMYIYGLRLGECLGLTQEDIKFIQVDDELKPALILRKRKGEERWACAKNLRMVESRKDYGTNKDKRVVIFITMAFYQDLAQFVNNELNMAKRKFKDGLSPLVADICNPEEFEHENNHYLFVNHSRGSRLNGQSWGRTLKSLFLEAGIPLDSETRELNLSHRLRHGCAMLFYRYIDEAHRLSLEKLQIYLRHANIKTTLIYTKPTLADTSAIKENFQGELFETAPYLKL